MLAFNDFPSHVRLMLLTARTRLTGNEGEQVQTLVVDAGMDWQGFLAVTAHHRLTSLVFETLDGVRPDGLPAFVREELQQRAKANAFEALRATAEVKRIVKRFAEAGLELSVMKGVPLSQMVFGNANARHVGDIDLLTSSAQATERLPEQIALLAEMGYARVNPASRLTPRRMASYVSFWKDLTFRNEATGFELDLHWRLFNNRFHAANRLVADASYTMVTVYGAAMRVFSMRDQFLYIAAHGVLDAWTYLKSLADVAGFLRLFTPAELDEALARAEELGLLAQISGAVHLANDWMGTEAGSARRLLGRDEASAKRIRQRTTKMLLRQNFQPIRSYPSPAQWLMLEIELVPGMRSLMEIARRFVWRPRVWASVDLPDRFFWMYPVLGLLMPPRSHSVEE